MKIGDSRMKKYLKHRYGINDLREVKGALLKNCFDFFLTKGRRQPIECSHEDELWTSSIDPFLFDTLKIKQSKAYRRLMSKTQVFVNTENCHVGNRFKHTCEVEANAIILAEMLGLNTHLVQAIAVGHDIGHGPFGHLGEQIFFDNNQQAFKHDVFGVVLAQKIERSGRGLNLSYEVLEGISLHSGKIEIIKGKPLEYSIVRLADKIAYIFSDINDIIRNGLIPCEEISRLVNEFGSTQRERTGRVLAEIIVESARAGRLVFAETELGEKFMALKDLMYERVYHQIDHQIHREAVRCAYDLLQDLYYGQEHVLWPILTDREVNELTSMAMRSRKVITSDIRHFGVYEIADSFRQAGRQLNEINVSDLDLGWSN